MKGNLDQLTVAELEKVVVDSKSEIRKERFKAVTGKLDDPKKTRELKKAIARALTVKREYELGTREKKA